MSLTRPRCAASPTTPRIDDDGIPTRRSCHWCGDDRDDQTPTTMTSWRRTATASTSRSGPSRRRRSDRRPSCTRNRRRCSWKERTRKRTRTRTRRTSGGASWIPRRTRPCPACSPIETPPTQTTTTTTMQRRSNCRRRSFFGASDAPICRLGRRMRKSFHSWPGAELCLKVNISSSISNPSLFPSSSPTRISSVLVFWIPPPPPFVWEAERMRSQKKKKQMRWYFSEH